MITTDHLNAALDLAARRGLTARDITGLRIDQAGHLIVVIQAALPSAPKAKFKIELKAHGERK